MTLDCSGREALDDLVRPFYLLEGRNVPDFRNSIGAQYGEFLGNGDNVGKLRMLYQRNTQFAKQIAGANRTITTISGQGINLFITMEQVYTNDICRHH